jgi:uncharacterized protein
MSDPSLIFETVHGSTCYNLAREGSDVDVKGIIVGPRQWYFGIEPCPEQVPVGPDHVRYELRKFIRLAADANPTLIELLFTDPVHHRTVTTSGKRLLEHRTAFLSKRIGDRFGGYALAQMKRIRTHRSYLLNPPSHVPTREEFGLPQHTVIPADQLTAAETLLNEHGNPTTASLAADVSPNFLEVLARERRYKTAQKGWQSYQTWLRSRNPMRSELEARFGYDTKHAMHLVRLQRMGVETLQTGKVFVTRSDRDELLAVRDGAWTFDQLESEAHKAGLALRAAAQSSALPESPDVDFLESLCIQIIERELGV